MKCWYCPCTEFRLPKSVLSVLVNSDCFVQSPETVLCTYLLIRFRSDPQVTRRVIRRQVISTLYPATLVGYKYELSTGFERGMSIYVKGWLRCG